MKETKTLTKKQLKRKERIEIKKKFRQWSIDVRNRDNNVCVICGSIKKLSAHHIIPREVKELRFDTLNGISICCDHHKYSYACSAHKNSFVFLIWLKHNRPEQYEYLMNKVVEMQLIPTLKYP